MRGSASPSHGLPFSVNATRWRGPALKRGIAAPPDQVDLPMHAHQFAAIARGRVNVVARVELTRRTRSSASSSALPSRRGKSRATGMSATPPIASRTPCSRRTAGAGDDGEIAVTARDFAKRVAGCWRRGGKLIRPRSVHRRAASVAIMPGEEFLCRDAPAPPGAAQMHLAAERAQHQRQLGARIGMRDRAADRAAAARLGMTRSTAMPARRAAGCSAEVRPRQQRRPDGRPRRS